MIYKIIISIFCLFAVFGDFLANEKPIYCKYNNSHYFPIFRGYLIDLGWSKPYDEFSGVRWSEIDSEKIIWTPIPYSYHTIDRKNMNYRSPIGTQQIESTRFRHWLGTDAIGRDVFAGIIHGTRIAFSVGLIAMAIALALGIFMGSLSGYFGNDSISLKNYQWMGLVVGIIPSFFISFFGRTAQLWLEGGFFNWTLSLIIFMTLMFFFFKAFFFLKILPFFNKNSFVPVDGMIIRLIEIVDSIPTLLLLLSALAILEKPSLFWVMAIIGLLNWTGIARLLRGEFLKIKKMAFVDTAKILELGNWHIFLKEILPNALQPVIVSISFGMAGSILLLVFLSFL